jgi:hypothetical protein
MNSFAKETHSEVIPLMSPEHQEIWNNNPDKRDEWANIGREHMFTRPDFLAARDAARIAYDNYVDDANSANRYALNAAGFERTKASWRAQAEGLANHFNSLSNEEKNPNLGRQFE